MMADSPVLKVLLVIFAVIGVLAVILLVGMMFMHGSMMNMMGPGMAAACQSMMAKLL